MADDGWIRINEQLNPSLETIREECLKLQATWSEDEELQRRVGSLADGAAWMPPGCEDAGSTV